MNYVMKYVHLVLKCMRIPDFVYVLRFENIFCTIGLCLILQYVVIDLSYVDFKLSISSVCNLVLCDLIDLGPLSQRASK